MPCEGDEERVLVLAPVGRDTHLLGLVVDEAGLRSQACADAPALANELRQGAGAVLLTEEALGPATVEVLRHELASQPPWGDLPMVLLVDSALTSGSRRSEVATLRAAGNLTILERPARALTVVTALQSALRARRRQYEIRDLLRREGEARREAEAMSRVKDEFLATVSHELRTPLGAILTWTRLLTGGGLDREKGHQGLLAIQRSVTVLSNLIEELLDMARGLSGKLQLRLQEVELGPIVLAAVEVLRPAAETKGIAMRAEVSPVPILRADPDRLQQVVWNLLSNAVKFTSRGGEVVLRLGHRGDCVWIEVQDSGIGIEPQFFPFLFERFRQADATPGCRQGGLGLGLAISRQIVELHGGTIQATSPGLGQGAVFTVELPLPL